MSELENSEEEQLDTWRKWEQQNEELKEKLDNATNESDDDLSALVRKQMGELQALQNETWKSWERRVANLKEELNAAKEAEVRQLRASKEANLNQMRHDSCVDILTMQLANEERQFEAAEEAIEDEIESLNDKLAKNGDEWEVSDED